MTSASRIDQRFAALRSEGRTAFVAFVTAGVQYMYGKRVTIANGRGQEQVLIGKFRVAF